MTSPSAPTVCPSCGATGGGRFCSACGAALAATSCAGCGTALSAGARFCHSCGTPAPGTTTAPAARREVAVPWVLAGIALVALIAVFAAQRVGAPDGARLDAPLDALPQTALGQVPTRMAASDISGMSDRERASRLFDRVMLLAEERRADSIGFAAAGRNDSLQFFAQMAIQAHLANEPRDADVRYDLGRIAQAAGAPQLARVQADSILAAEPNHLLGLVLAASSARQLGDEAAASAFERRLLAAAPTEETRDLPEYSAHRADIIAAVEAVRASAPASR